MNIRPTDLPELRSSMLAVATAPHYLDKIREEQVPHPMQGVGPAEQVHLETDGLSRAELYYVTPEMGALATAAAETLPAFGLEAEDVPSRHGLMVFDASPMSVPHGEPPLDYQVCAVLWSTAQWGVLLSFYADRDATLAAELQAGVCAPRDAEYTRTLLAPLIHMLGRDTTVPFHNTGADEHAFALNKVLRTVRSTWLLMQQPLARTREAEPDRAARKRLRRAGQAPKPVRVIELRRPKTSGEPGDGNREYQHQWIVRGHWRQHWHPKRQVHRPVWIAPHVKGPEGAPLIGGEKVYALKR